jgi:perosamine synthetase
VRSGQQILAINGGEPVRVHLLPYGRQLITEADIAAVVGVLRSDWLTTGPKVGEFEEAVARYVGSRFAVSLSSGTAALHAAMFAAGIGPGDEAITSPLTFCATANAVLYQDGRPVFADVTADTLNLDPAQVAPRLTSRTKAIVSVAYAGHPSDMTNLARLAREHGLLLIDDACHALGARYGERPVGSIADMTVFSFHPVKHIATGEGGMVTTDSPRLCERLRLFRNHGLDRDSRERQASGQWRYEMTTLGFNYRLTDLASALGLSQLARIGDNLARRREIARRYAEGFAAIASLELPVERENVRSAWHLYPVRLRLERLSAGRDDVFAALRAEGLGVNVHYLPVHLHRYYRERFGYAEGEYPVAEDAYSRLITLPMFHGMADQDVDDVLMAAHKVLGHYDAG